MAVYFRESSKTPDIKSNFGTHRPSEITIKIDQLRPRSLLETFSSSQRPQALHLRVKQSTALYCKGFRSQIWLCRCDPLAISSVVDFVKELSAQRI